MKLGFIALFTALIFLSVRPLLPARPLRLSVQYDHLAREHLEVFGDKLAKEFGLCHILSGGGPLIDSRCVTWSLAFTSNKALTIEEARPLVQGLANSMWRLVQQDPAFGQYLEADRGKPLERTYLGYKLAFWDADVNRPLSPYLAQVTLSGNEVLYFYADPKTQALLPPIKEAL